MSRRVGGVILGLLILMLGGCTKREIEDRHFPTAMIIETTDLDGERMREQRAGTDYIDYGHVKAIILSELIAADAHSLQTVICYLEEDPVFAKNTLIFIGDEEVREQAKHELDELGIYLEDMCKNQPADLKNKETTLKDMMNYLHNNETEITISYLGVKDNSIVTDGVERITSLAVPTMNVPVAKKITE